MKKKYRIAGGFIAAMLCLVSIGHAALLPGLGEVSGTVTGPPKTTIVPVYLYNKERNVGYGVFAVNGTYRAVDVFPGHYEIEVQHWYVPSKDGLEMMDPVSVDVTAGGHAKANLRLKSVAPTQNYTGRETYKKGVIVQTYEEIYPPGPGREILEHSCIVCHGVNFIPSMTVNRAGWEALIHRMINGQGNGGLFSSQLSAGPPTLGPERLSEKELPTLLDYLAANFGPEAKQRAVLQDEWPALDPAALAKAQYIEYRVPNVPGSRKRGSHDVHFGQDGTVYSTNGPIIVRINPETGETKDYMIPDGNSSHGLTVDGDGTVWFAGSGNFVAHLDPTTGLFDQYQTTQIGLHGNTPVFNSKGDLWFSMLIGNKIGHWDRTTDTITYYESPVANADPYGMDIDHHDKVWYDEYFAGAITRFDPVTKQFKRFKVKTWPNSLRRLGPDSNDNMWFGVYGYMGKYGKLGRIDAKTGEITERDLPIKYGQPYDAKPDEQDNVWVASMNYLSKFNPKTGKFTIYPTPERTDIPKIEPTRDGSIWFAPREAGVYGYGSCASVLYPDKDAIKTLRAIPGPHMSNNYIAQYHGPFTKVTGVVKFSKEGAQNPEVAYEKTVGKPRNKQRTPNAPTPTGPQPQD